MMRKIRFYDVEVLYSEQMGGLSSPSGLQRRQSRMVVRWLGKICPLGRRDWLSSQSKVHGCLSLFINGQTQASARPDGTLRVPIRPNLFIGLDPEYKNAFQSIEHFLHQWVTGRGKIAGDVNYHGAFGWNAPAKQVLWRWKTSWSSLRWGVWSKMVLPHAFLYLCSEPWLYGWW